MNYSMLSLYGERERGRLDLYGLGEASLLCLEPEERYGDLDLIRDEWFGDRDDLLTYLVEPLEYLPVGDLEVRLFAS